MEFLEGQNLAELLKKGPLPIRDALRIAAEVAEALECAHRKGITHRDLKPSNIALTRDGAKLLDFGLAKRRPGGSVTSDLSLTPPDTPLGTVPYMAPEQLEGQIADHRTDIFALGSVIYEMVTGRARLSAASKRPSSRASFQASHRPSGPPRLRRHPR